MDTVGKPLGAVTAEFEARGIPYTVALTRPDRLNFPLLNDCLYVVRQIEDADGGVCLLAAAKMGRQA